MRKESTKYSDPAEKRRGSGRIFTEGASFFSGKCGILGKTDTKGADHGMELRELLEIGPGLTALIGGGGKTTLMYHLASELRQQGTVLVCTTTKIWPPAHLRVCTEEGTLREELRRRGIACTGTPTEQGKLTAPAIDGWETMADFVLVEADGSAGRPFKAHADWEPVLPEERQATVLVMGADGFGKPISRMAHRPELYARLAGATEDQEVTPELAARVVRLEGLHDRVFLNQVDRAEEWPLARRLAAALDCPVTAGTLREGRWQRLK